MELFEDALERVRLRSLFAVAGYVVMPEHVHLLVGRVARLSSAMNPPEP
jgi:REP element-mobilizing transposase RayT